MIKSKKGNEGYIAMIFVLLVLAFLGLLITLFVFLAEGDTNPKEDACKELGFTHYYWEPASGWNSNEFCVKDGRKTKVDMFCSGFKCVATYTK